jgi:hypothetical protein
MPNANVSSKKIKVNNYYGSSDDDEKRDIMRGNSREYKGYLNAK